MVELFNRLYNYALSFRTSVRPILQLPITKMINDQQIIDGFKIVIAFFGKPLAARIEQLFRNETKHFKSGNFLITLSPGMQATQNEYPFGWSSLAPFWTENPNYKPTGIHVQKENDSALAKASGAQKFMIFPSIEASLMTIAKLIHLRHDDAGTWFSNDPSKQQLYDKELDHIIPKFVNSIK